MYINDIIIHEHQKEIIKERSKLNFFKELNEKSYGKKSFAKFFKNELNLLVNQFDSDGIQFYGFSIDMLDLRVENPDFWKEVHETVELWISEIGQRVELIEFCYISIQMYKYNKNSLIKRKVSLELPKLYGIIGVRSIIGNNPLLDIEVKKVFRNIYDFQDIRVVRLIGINKIIKYWKRIIRKNNFRFHRFTRYSNNSNYDYGAISDFELTYNIGNKGPINNAFGLDEWRYSNTFQITGVKSKDPSNQTLIIYLLNLYLWHKNYKIFDAHIYEQVPSTFYSWKLFLSLDFLKKKNIAIFEYLKKIYPMQLNNINTIEIINRDWNKTVDEIILNNHYLSCIEINRDAIEYKDGVFFISENTFYSFLDDKIVIDQKMKNMNIIITKNYNFNGQDLILN